MPSLFVGSIGPHVSEESVQQAFTRYGPCVVNFRGAYAFVDFERERDAEEAHRQMGAGKPASMVDGTALRVEWSHRSAPGGHASRSAPAMNTAGYGASGGGGGGGPGACFECGATEHIARNCPARTERLRMGGGGSRGQSAEGRACYNCGQAGHLARNCTGPRVKSDAAPDSSSYHAARGPRQPDTRTCYECGQPGHLARDCSSKAGGSARRNTREEQAHEEEEEEEEQNGEQYDEYEASASGSSAEYSRSPSQSGSEGASTPDVGHKRHPKKSDGEAKHSVKRARPVGEKEEEQHSASVDFESMTLKQLKAEMEKRGLDNAGLKVKKDFVEALEKAVNADA
ncbi:hypothetical protein CDCA_CDCA04G1372 [Cyanidium caldarium]|uniref:Uncharacterized protein n=1 Tax=Cyanidium caldarium TaxID=2771 RepID=A0AAV9ISN4_CYACA|nr:hypothetical protein CDCA_CDCA04G1372 [Cyanidium caldarium]